MKLKFSILCLLFIVAFSSCSKSDSNNDDGSAKISCTIDGSAKVFNFGATALRYDDAGNYSVQVIGFEGSQVSNHITISMVGNQPIRAAQYTEDGGDMDDTRIGMITYTQTDGDATYISDDSDTNPALITITSISSTSVQGTFSGDIYLADGDGNGVTKKTVSNGTFNLAFAQ